MIFGKYINRYYLRHAPVLLLGILALLMVDYIQLLVPQLYRLVINGVNLNVLNDTVMHSSLYYKAFNMFNPFL